MRIPLDMYTKATPDYLLLTQSLRILPTILFIIITSISLPEVPLQSYPVLHSIQKDQINTVLKTTNFVVMSNFSSRLGDLTVGNSISGFSNPADQFTE